MRQTRAGMNLKTWQAPECPFSIEYAPAVLEEIRQAAVDAFFALPHGGAEIGGVLFGTYDAASVRIMAFRPIECEHVRGPRFLLSEKDQEYLQALLRKSATDPALRALTAVGWYHTHTRSDIFLCGQDLEIYDRFFSASWQIALVVRPDGMRPTRAGFFYRESNGEVHAESTYGEFVLEVPSFDSPCNLSPVPPPTPAPMPPCPAVVRHAGPHVDPPLPRSNTLLAPTARWHRRGVAIAAALGGLLFASALTCVESVLAARMVTPKEVATAAPRPAVIVPTPPAPSPTPADPVPPQEMSTEGATPEPEQSPTRKAQPKRWAGLQLTVPRTGLPSLPQAPAADSIAGALPAGNWAATPIAAAPRRVAFEGGTITFFADAVFVADKKHPQGIPLPAHGVDYNCESKSQSCTIIVGTTRIRVKHAADYKMLVEYLTQAR